MRYTRTCHPQNEGDKPDYDNDCGKMWFVNKSTLWNPAGVVAKIEIAEEKDLPFWLWLKSKVCLF